MKQQVVRTFFLSLCCVSVLLLAGCGQRANVSAPEDHVQDSSAY